MTSRSRQSDSDRCDPGRGRRGSDGVAVPAELIAQALDSLQRHGLPFADLEVNAGFRRQPKQDALWYIADAGTGRSGRPWLLVTAGDARVTGDVRTPLVVFKSWESDGQALTSEESAELHQQLGEITRQREAQDQWRRDAAAEQARALWSEASEVLDGHAYLTAKGVQGHGIRRRGEALLIPVRDARGAFHGLQLISADATKRFHPGSAVAGHFHRIGEPGRRLYLCEGYATGATLHEASGEAVAVAFSAGNLGPVAAALRTAFPHAELVIAGDDDRWTAGNPGRTRATAAAAAVGARLVFPRFGGPAGGTGRPTDFNDLAQLHGLAEVARQLRAAPAVAAGRDWPAPAPLRALRPPVAAFDPVLLPGVLRPWLTDIAERMQCPPDYPAVGGMLALGATVGRQLGIRPKRQDDWLEVPNLWGAVVGPPGLMKSPALAESTRPLLRLARESRAAHQQGEAQREAGEELRDARLTALRAELKKAVNGRAGRREAAIMEDIAALKAEGEPQRCPRYLLNDATVEKLGEILAENPHGVLLFRDELVGWLRSLDREGAENARPFYLEAWNGTGSYTYDRIGRGTIHIESACVAVLGGIQPGPLAAYVKGALSDGRGADGLLQRLQLLVWPDVSGEWRDVDRWPASEARARAFGLFQRLAALDLSAIGAERDADGGIPFLRFDGAAQEVFREWRGQLENHRLRRGEPEVIESHLAKYRKLVPALALLCHLAEGGTGPVTEEALLRACAWDEYLQTHARRLYACATQAETQAAHALAARILAGAVADGFTPREVYRNGWSGLGQEETLQAVAVLEDHDWLRTERVITGGRPSLRCLINPRLRSEP
jgi:putative DNA primase/helicase